MRSSVLKKPVARKSLFNLSHNKKAWSSEEDAALVQYICLFWEDASTDKWPTTNSVNEVSKKLLHSNCQRIQHFGMAVPGQSQKSRENPDQVWKLRYVRKLKIH